MLKLVALASLLMTGILAQGPGKVTPAKDSAKSGASKGPLPYTTRSIARGRQFYLLHCVECHDQDGRGLNRRDFNGTAPADLTDPADWTYGTSPEAIFSSIHDGTKDDMPSFKDKLQDEQIWHLVNLVRSFWPESKRPKLESDVNAK